MLYKTQSFLDDRCTVVFDYSFTFFAVRGTKNLGELIRSHISSEIWVNMTIRNFSGRFLKTWETKKVLP